MLPGHRKLSSRIFGILVIFFLVACTAIGMTLLISWQLEGAAAAINDAGSERMRTYRLTHLLARAHERPVADQFAHEIGVFERVLDGLERGDPTRPLFVSRDAHIAERTRAVRQEWQNVFRPLLQAAAAAQGDERRELLAEVDVQAVRFVAGINALVLSMEGAYARNTDRLRSFQLGLVALALIGTVILITYFGVMVIRPVRRLQEGIGRMEGEDFTVRLPITSEDEFGQLAEGFNRMAGHLQDLYATLEQRVQSKTRTLEERNEELAVLYEVAAFLNEPAGVEELCRGVLQRIMGVLGASAGAVQLLDPANHKLFMVVQEGLPPGFGCVASPIKVGECVCGEVAERLAPVLTDLAWRAAGSTRGHCAAAGFRAVSAIPVSVNKRPVGVVNLFFREGRTLSDTELRLLDTLAQHLGVAVENQRLVSREKELAVSEERNLLAQELHDSIAQGLAFLNLQAQMLDEALRTNDTGEAREAVAQIRAGVQESYDDVRELLVHFRTRVHHNDLDAAVRSALERFENQAGIPVRYVSAGRGAPLPAEYETQALHIVQEALSNMRKHAFARSVEVFLEQRPGGLTVAVRDDGIGFDPVAPAADGHVGLSIMQERARRIGGQLELSSSPGAGTEVRLTLPAEIAQPKAA